MKRRRRKWYRVPAHTTRIQCFRESPIQSKKGAPRSGRIVFSGLPVGTHTLSVTARNATGGESQPGVPVIIVVA